jgi:hypothetical protein
MSSIQALLTDEARRRRAESSQIGKAFVVVGFSLGNAGHDPLDPTTALTPDPAMTTPASVVFGPKSVSGFSNANDACPIWECVVGPGEGVTLFSSVYLIAQILSSPIPGDPEVGTTFLYAIYNMPQRPKFDVETLQLMVAISG